jgi:hypothetical protein
MFGCITPGGSAAGPASAFMQEQATSRQLLLAEPAARLLRPSVMQRIWCWGGFTVRLHVTHAGGCRDGEAKFSR